MSKRIKFVLFVAAAVSLLPWTNFIFEMLGAFAFVGVLLAGLLFLGGYGLFKEWRASRFLAIVGPLLTSVLFAIITANVFRGRADEPGAAGSLAPDLVWMLVPPLVLSLACLIVAIIHCAPHTEA